MKFWEKGRVLVLVKKAKRSQAKKEKKKKSGIDISFLVLVLLLLIVGLVTMFSASYVNAYYVYGDSFEFISKQLIFAVAGVVAMLVIAHIDYHILHKLMIPIFVVSLILLTVVLFMPELNGARRWIIIPGLGTFQPSELAKFTTVLMFAHFISIYYNKMKTFRYGILPFMIILAILAGMVILEKHLSGTIIIVMIAFIMMIIGGTRLRYLFIPGGIAIAGVTCLFLFTNLLDHAKLRLQYWLDPFADIQGKTFQTYQSLLAIGSGGLMGAGLGNSKQKFLYIPEPQNDFVFSIACEELGFIGATFIIILFVLLVWRGFVIAMRSPDKFGAMLAVGITVQVGVQALLNIAVVTNTIPNTGISLPFFSAGGSSLMMLLMEMGVVLSVSRYSMMEKT